MKKIWFSRRWYQLSAIYAWGNSCVLQLNPSSWFRLFQAQRTVSQGWNIALMSYDLMWEGTKNSFIQVHSSLLPIPNTVKGNSEKLTVKGNSKAGDGTTIFSSGPQFFTSYCDLEHPKQSRAWGWVSVKMCPPGSSKLYINSLREQDSISFLSPEFNKSYPTSDIKRYKEMLGGTHQCKRDAAPDLTIQINCFPFKHLKHMGQSHHITPVLPSDSITRPLHTPGADNTRAHKTTRGNTSPWVSYDYYYGTTHGHQLSRETKMAKATDFRVREHFQ